MSVAMTYDDLGRLLSRTQPDSGTETFGYSARGMTAYTNQLGLVTRYGYDAAGRKTNETNANAEVLRYGYNPAGDLRTLTDGKNQVTTWGYDRYGRVTNKLDQATVEILRYAYDGNTRLTNRWSAAKGNTGYAYDAVGNLTSIHYPTDPPVSFAYDAMNRRTTMLDGIGTTSYTYDAAGHMLTEDGPFDSDTMTNIYSSRKRIALNLEQPTDYWPNSFEWDTAGRLYSVTSPAGTFHYRYTALDPTFSGRLVQHLGLPNGGAITNSFDPVARLASTVLKSSGNTTLDAAVYGYNIGSQRTAWTNAAGACVEYGYDPIGQLTVANSSLSGESRGYTYDPAWNLQYRTNSGTVDTFLVDGKNQLTNAPSYGLSYDANGNPTGPVFAGASTTLTYDDENRLTSFSAGGNTSTFAYDGLGRLRTRTETGGTIVNYIYDGMRVIQERDGSNWPQVAYTRGLDLSGTFEGAGGIGGLLARSHEFTNCSPTITYCLTNASGYGIEDLAVWDNDQTYVTGVWVGTASGDTWSYSFPGVPGRTYYVWGLSQDYYYIQVFADQFAGTLENRGVYFDTSGGVTVTDWGQPLCDGGTSGRWLTHNYYHADGNGNVTCLMNPNDTLVASYRYDPYGNTLAQSGALADANTYRFSSKEFHASTGMYYYGYRFYLPSLQRWQNRDPLSVQKPQEPPAGIDLFWELLEGPNLYWSFRNNPISEHDGDGRCSKPPRPVPVKQFPDCWPKLPPFLPGKKWTLAQRLESCKHCCSVNYGGSPAPPNPLEDDFAQCNLYCVYKFSGGK